MSRIYTEDTAGCLMAGGVVVILVGIVAWMAGVPVVDGTVRFLGKDTPVGVGGLRLGASEQDARAACEGMFGNYEGDDDSGSCTVLPSGFPLGYSGRTLMWMRRGQVNGILAVIEAPAETAIAYPMMRESIAERFGNPTTYGNGDCENAECEFGWGEAAWDFGMANRSKRIRLFFDNTSSGAGLFVGTPRSVQKLEESLESSRNRIGEIL